MGCSPWGRKELDTTERLTLHFTGPLIPVCQGSGVIDPFLREIACAGNKQTPPLALNQEKLSEPAWFLPNSGSRGLFHVSACLRVTSTLARTAPMT